MLAPLLNFFLFFRDAMQQSIQSQRRRVAFEKKQRMEQSQPRHVCCLCDATDLNAPEREFRYRMCNGVAGVFVISVAIVSPLNECAGSLFFRFA